MYVCMSVKTTYCYVFISYSGILFLLYTGLIYLSGWIGSYIYGALLANFQPDVLNPLVLTGGCLLSDFVTSASCVPDAQMQNNLWHASRRTQRTADWDEHFLGRISCACDLFKDAYLF